MRKLLNTLFITTGGTYLARDGQCVLVRHEGETRLRAPVHNLDGIVCMGNVSCSPPLMELCADAGVTISHLSLNGKFIARIQGPVSGNVLLRREQYRVADDLERCADIAASMVLGKVHNCRGVMQRTLRRGGSANDSLQAAVDQHLDIERRINPELGLERIRGLEGEAANAYFGAFNDLINQDNGDFHFAGRSRRPPKDNVNALLSFAYTMLVHDAVSALESVGLDPAVGFLHRDRPGRPSLALDMMEEFRSLAADRLCLALINRGQIKAGGFTTDEVGGVRMDDKTRKSVIVTYQERKKEEIKHPFTGEKMPWGLALHVQALLLARYLRGELDAYPPFVWK